MSQTSSQTRQLAESRGRRRLVEYLSKVCYEGPFPYEAEKRDSLVDIFSDPLAETQIGLYYEHIPRLPSMWGMAVEGVRRNNPLELALEKTQEIYRGLEKSILGVCLLPVSVTQLAMVYTDSEPERLPYQVFHMRFEVEGKIAFRYFQKLDLFLLENGLLKPELYEDISARSGN